MAARLVEGLPEVGQQVLPAARRGLGVAAHHVDPRLLDLAVRLRDLDRVLRGLGRCALVGVRDVPLLVEGDRAGLLEQRHRARRLLPGQPGLLAHLLHGDRLLVALDDRLHRRQRLLVGLAAREEAPQPDVLGAVVQHRLRRLPVPTRPAHLLVVGVQRVGDGGVQDEAHVGLVDAHAERRRRDDDVELAVEESLVHDRAVRGLATRVVCRRREPELGQRRGVLLALLARGGVDDPGLGGGRSSGDHRLPLGVGVGVGLHAQSQVGSVEAGDDEVRLAHAQPLDDLRPDGRRGSRRQRQDGGMPEALDDGAEPQVVGAEVVPPRRDAVGLVYDEQRRPRRRQLVEDLLLGELLGGEEDVLDVAGAQALEGLRAVGGAHAAVDLPHPLLPGAAGEQVLDLVSLQRDERAHDDGRSVQQQRRSLVDQRLARARRHHHERVAALDDGRHRLPLPRAQRLDPEHVLHHLLQPLLDVRLRHPASPPARHSGPLRRARPRYPLRDDQLRRRQTGRRNVRNVTDQRSAGTAGMLCCQTVRARPARTYADLGCRCSSNTRRSGPFPRWNRSAQTDARETPTTSPNAGASRCQPIVALGG